jgi:allantoin racemase
MKRLAVLNPNTNTATTAHMAGIVRALAPAGISVEGYTMEHGPAIVTDAVALAASAQQIVQVAHRLAREGVDAILISGFGDPALKELRATLPIPVTGIAEAGMAAAAALGPFSIITTTPDLEESIRSMATGYGHAGALVSLRITPGVAEKVMADPDNLQRALIEIAQHCARDGALSVLIGGGPLAQAARAVSDAIDLVVIEPVAAGARLAFARMGGAVEIPNLSSTPG